VHRQVLIAPLVDEDGREVMGPHRIRYDYLVLAVGSVSNDFGIPGVAEHCLFLDSRTQADRFRQKLLNQCLRVSRVMSLAPGADARVRVVIVGGGRDGVELAAELYNAAAGLAHYGLEVFDESRLELTLIEAGPRILPALPEKLADAARGELEALGVRILTGQSVVEARDGAIVTSSGEVIAADLRVWAAGIRGADVLKDIGGLGDQPGQPTGGPADAADDAGRADLRDRRLRLLHPRGRDAARAAARAVGAPDGGRGLPQPAPSDRGRRVDRVPLPGPWLAGVAQPLLDGGQPDGQPDRRPAWRWRGGSRGSCTCRCTACTSWPSTAGCAARR
jgi:hypothetical protein